MSKFTDSYKATLNKNDQSAIADNPIMALVMGVPDDKVREILRLESWTETDIEDLINSVKIKEENK